MRGHLLLSITVALFSVCDAATTTTTQDVRTAERFNSTECRLDTVTYNMKQQVVDFLARKAKLLEYHLVFDEYSSNPLLKDTRWMYRSNVWSRVGTSQGQTILNLAFNYAVLSLMTLSLGVEKFDLHVRDSPSGCVGNLTEEDKNIVVLTLLLRDLDADGPVTVWEGESTVCHSVIEQVHGAAKFADRCCYQIRSSNRVDCFTGIPNQWLTILDVLLAVLHFTLFIFGPFAMPGWMYTAVDDTIEYIVKLQEPLYKTMCISREETMTPNVFARHTLDMRNRKHFRRCKKLIRELPSGVKIPIKISQFDLQVNYRKLLSEKKVPVGMVECMSKAVFLCKLRELDAFRDCCEADMYGCCKREKSTKWISFCNYFGRIMLVLLIPLPFYMRLAMYYTFEHPEIVERSRAASVVGLNVEYNHRLLQYLTPTHPLFVAAYCVFIVTGIVVACFSGRQYGTRLQQAVITSFAELKDLSMLKAIGLLISNFLWPFKRFGIWGCFIGLVYWPLLMPISVVACVIYCLPLVFVTCRILRHMFGRRLDGDLPRGVHAFSADVLLETLDTPKVTSGCRQSLNLQHLLLNVLATGAALLTLYSVMLISSEVVGFVAEVICFTMMGLIVNASKVLKYGSLIFLVVIYSYDCYNNVSKKYIKLNEALFSEVKDRLGNSIFEYTSLPAYLQYNRGFKACEASEQADYERTDDISTDNSLHWNINDLIMFIDSHDNPRIPKQLFEDVCQIRVSGSPGPVYYSLLQATGKFLVIVCFLIFVFLVVLTFGDTYKISSTNQMLATMAGGFMPFIFSSLLKPASPEIETKLVSFKSKLEEIIINFEQAWPMADFQFEIEQEPSDDDDKNGDDVSKDNKKSLEKSSANSKKSTRDSSEPGSDIKRNVTRRVRQETETYVDVIKSKCEQMTLESADGQCVDILVLVSESDYEWDLEWSTFDDFETLPTVVANGDHNHVVKTV